jgi:hypothetical protein
MADKVERVANFHKKTLKVSAKLRAAAGLRHASELRPRHLGLRVIGQSGQARIERCCSTWNPANYLTMSSPSTIYPRYSVNTGRCRRRNRFVRQADCIAALNP